MRPIEPAGQAVTSRRKASEPMTVFPPRMPAMMPTKRAFDQKKRCYQTCGHRLPQPWRGPDARRR